ncbi:MAG: hypothetical protein ACNS63_11190 [Candidatus Nitrospinota bacterium M3_3B_026]
MSVAILGWEFETFQDMEKLEDKAGVYVVISIKDGAARVIDAGESERIRTKIISHERTPCWSEHKYDGVVIAVRYVEAADREERVRIESEIRARYSPPCGGPEGAAELTNVFTGAIKEEKKDDDKR